jgi:glycogen debranching enzyme
MNDLVKMKDDEWLATDAKREARRRFLMPIMEHLNSAGLGHVSEIADADAPHTARGCPFQAWSVAELTRLDRMVLRVADEQEIRASSRAHAASNGRHLTGEASR